MDRNFKKEEEEKERKEKRRDKKPSKAKQTEKTRKGPSEMIVFYIIVSKNRILFCYLYVLSPVFSVPAL